MPTIIFKNEADFDNRPNKEDNGVTQECLDILYNASLEEYDKENTGNTGCFNVVNSTDCKNCIICYECKNSEDLLNCSNCEDSSILENCKNMISCTDCIDCSFCIDAEALEGESFIQGEPTEENEEDNSSNAPTQVITGEQSSNTIDPIGNLNNTGI